MSVAFAAPRQRGKGEITPAAIQKVGGGEWGSRRGCGAALPAPLGRVGAGCSPRGGCGGLGPAARGGCAAEGGSGPANGRLGASCN